MALFPTARRELVRQHRSHPVYEGIEIDAVRPFLSLPHGLVSPFPFVDEPVFDVV